MARYLTEGDYVLLLEMLREYRRERKNLDRPIDETTSQKSPDVFIARVPDAGIPALSLVGTAGTEGGEDTAGSATCDIYRVATDGSLEAYERQKEVFNVHSTAVGGDYTVVIKSKSGTYLVPSGAAISTCVDDDGTGTGVCCTLVGVDVDSLPVIDAGEAAYVLGLDVNGCLVRLEIGEAC